MINYEQLQKNVETWTRDLFSIQPSNGLQEEVLAHTKKKLKNSKFSASPKINIMRAVTFRLYFKMYENCTSEMFST